MMREMIRKEEGISALEYVLIALVVALAIVVGAQFLGTTMNDKFQGAGDKLNEVTPE